MFAKHRWNWFEAYYASTKSNKTFEFVIEMPFFRENSNAVKRIAISLPRRLIFPEARKAQKEENRQIAVVHSRTVTRV